MAFLKDLLLQKEIKSRWVISNWMGLGEITVMYAPKDHHKTGMALKIAMEVITSGQELGASLSGKVLYLSLDTPRVEMMNRVKALMESKYPLHAEEIGSSLNISWDSVNLTNDNWETIKGDIKEQYEVQGEYHKEIKIRYIDRVHSYSSMGKALKHQGYRLLVIDTLSKALVGSGVNDDAIIRKVIYNLREIIRGASDNVSILLIHHSGKDASRGMMGTSILSNDISTVLKIKKKKDGFELVREKHKSSLSGKGIPFKSRSVVINYNDELHESIYVDIGTGLDEFDAQIVEQFNKGLSKKEINRNTRLLGLGNNTTDKSFAVSFNRRWNKLIDTGFIENKKQDNKT